LAALLDDRIDAAGRELLFTHLAACPLCYEQWLALATVADGEASRKVLPGPWGRRGWSAMRRYWISGMALALAASLAFFLLPQVRPATVEELVTSAYQGMPLPAAGEGEVRPRLPLPWEEGQTGYGFTPESTPSEASQAFANGLAVGRTLLARETNAAGSPPPVTSKLAHWSLAGRWETHAAADFYWLGRWLILLQYAGLVSDFPDAVPFWQEQGKTLARLQSAFSGRQEEEAKRATAGLQRLAVGLAELKTHPEDRRSLRRLLGALAALATELAPAGPPG
jgi:hypothetical protein